MAKLHHLPESKFEDEDGLDNGSGIEPDETPDAEFRDPEYDDDCRDLDAEDGSQEWYARKQK